MVFVPAPAPATRFLCRSSLPASFSLELPHVSIVSFWFTLFPFVAFVLCYPVVASVSPSFLRPLVLLRLLFRTAPSVLFLVLFLGSPCLDEVVFVAAHQVLLCSAVPLPFPLALLPLCLACGPHIQPLCLPHAWLFPSCVFLYVSLSFPVLFFALCPGCLHLCPMFSQPFLPLWHCFCFVDNLFIPLQGLPSFSPLR